MHRGFPPPFRMGEYNGISIPLKISPNNRLSHDEPCGSRLFFCDAWSASRGAQAMVQLLSCFPRSYLESTGLLIFLYKYYKLVDICLWK